MSTQTFSPVRFECYEKIGRHLEHWSGVVTHLINHGSHYEIYISSRSEFVLIVGEYVSGSFISIPALNAGSGLADYENYFWNKECLASIMNKVDAATIAEALRTLKLNNFI